MKLIKDTCGLEILQDFSYIYIKKEEKEKADKIQRVHEANALFRFTLG